MRPTPLSHRYKKQCNFFIHPYAYEAYRFYNQISPLFQPDNLESSFIDELKKIHIIHGCQINDKPKEIYIFSGFDSVCFDIGDVHQSGSIVLKYTKKDIPSSKEIHKLSWCSVWNTILNSISDKKLEEFRRQYNSYSKSDVNQELFGNPILTQETLGNLCNVSRSTLLKQGQKLNLDIENNVEIRTIFDELSEEFIDG